MPCPNGCGGEWRYPEAERERVIERRDNGRDHCDDGGEQVEHRDHDRAAGQDTPDRVVGNADQANRIGADFIRGALRNWGFLESKDDGPESASGNRPPCER
ncbi:hypothetical protein SAMN05421630_104245 [Prauserella marina]|uniref:Uncharacterized protein n=1 Tax=Prauserella marina TaxID=530584 RepID=A0A1G6Q6R5_9PSEU|nr:hypothetical protein DES30_104246 [Prauserella marina]SDC87614.1 hypothetical protein SAMN05421630_104245 [Prauserella marina]